MAYAQRISGKRAIRNRPSFTPAAHAALYLARQRNRCSYRYLRHGKARSALIYCIGHVGHVQQSRAYFYAAPPSDRAVVRAQDLVLFLRLFDLFPVLRRVGAVHGVPYALAQDHVLGGGQSRGRRLDQNLDGRLAQVVARAHRVAVGARVRDQQHVVLLRRPAAADRSPSRSPVSQIGPTTVTSSVAGLPSRVRFTMS